MTAYSFFITDGPDEGKTYHLEQGITLLGRRDNPDEDDPSGSNRWTLTDPAISRTHARIDWDGERAPVLIHLSATNATLLDGRIVTGKSIDDGQSLAQGDQIRMGQTAMEVKQSKSEGRWCLKDLIAQSANRALAEAQPMNISGIQICCLGSSPQVTSLDKDSEAFVLRSIGQQTWTTCLKPNEAVNLKALDIIRTPEAKLLLIDQDQVVPKE